MAIMHTLFHSKELNIKVTRIAVLGIDEETNRLQDEAQDCIRVCRTIEFTEVQNLYNFRARRRMYDQQKIQLQVNEQFLESPPDERIMWGKFLI